MSNCVWEEGCDLDRPVYGRGLCQLHYNRARRAGRLADYPKARRETRITPFRRDGGWWKLCPLCERVLPAAEFWAQRPPKRNRDREAPYLQTYCRTCSVQGWNEWWAEGASEEYRERKFEANRKRESRYAGGRRRDLARVAMRVRKSEGRVRRRKQPGLNKRFKSRPRAPEVWRVWAYNNVLDRPTRSVRRRRPRTFDLDGAPEWGLYMERVAVSRGKPLEFWVLDKNGKIVGAYSFVPPAYRKFVFGCPNNHSAEQLGTEPGPCAQCRADKAPYISASLRLTG